MYLQLANLLLARIKMGKFSPEQKFPSSLDLAYLLKLNRLTVSKAYQELYMEGWLTSAVGKKLNL
ncbi:GntR family transcriptional regulator [Myroides odoratus]|uniref:GntR family transcriptional regulator n=1 Tax=Myroides odoratus TaxID=256 RepID=UPI0039AF50D5